MQNVTVVPRRPSVASGFMQDLLPMVQQQAAEKTAEEERQQKLHEMYFKALLTETDPARRAAAYAQAPPEVQAMMPNPASLPTPPTPPKTPEQMAQDRAAQGSMSAMNAGDPEPVAGQSMNAPPTSLVGRPLPNPTPVSGGSDTPPLEGSGDTVPQRDAPSIQQRLIAWMEQYRLGSKDGKGPSKEELATFLTGLTGGDQGLTQASAIDDKRALNAHDTQIELPQVTPKVAHENAQAFQARAAGQNQLSEIPLHAAQTKAATEGKNSDDAKAIAGAIVNGNQPPEFTNMRAMAGPVRAELARQGYNLTTAEQDWKATQKYLGTLNGAQQVRLRQAVDFTDESLGKVEELAKKWDAGRFKVLNRGTMLIAMHGGLGKEANALATELNSQIQEVAADLAVVYRGGNSPTDEALKGAQQMLNSSWDKDVLLSNIGLIRQNLGYRRNSLKAAGVAGNANNPYDTSRGTTSAPSVPSPTAPATLHWNTKTNTWE